MVLRGVGEVGGARVVDAEGRRVLGHHAIGVVAVADHVLEELVDRARVVLDAQLSEARLAEYLVLVVDEADLRGVVAVVPRLAVVQTVQDRTLQHVPEVGHRVHGRECRTARNGLIGLVDEQVLHAVHIVETDRIRHAECD